MNKLILLLVALLAVFASVSAQSAPVTVSISFSQTISGTGSISSSISNSVSNSQSLSNSVSNSLSNSMSPSLSTSFSSSISNSLSSSVSITMSNTASQTASETASTSSTRTLSNTITTTNTQTGTQSASNSITPSISASWSSSLSAPATMTPSMTGAPPPTNLAQVTAGCGNGRKIVCISWARPVGVPALNYYVTITGVVSGAKRALNFTNGETFAMFTGLNPATAYVVSVQTLFMGSLSNPATLNVMTAAPAVKQMPSLGITGFSCKSMVSTTQRKKRNVVCNWTNGVTPYVEMNLRIKCTGKQGTAFDGKHRNVRRMIKAGQSSHTEGGFFPNARCKIIANPAYSTGPGRRVVQIIEIN